MAYTALKDNEIQEFFDSEDVIKNYAKNLASLIKSSQHCVVYTGAGISTSAGISDFRGPSGVWTLRSKGMRPEYKNHVRMPTLTHMAIKKLVDEGVIKYVVSQNTDGLHVKSGIPHSKIAELHGNTNKEYCPKCGKVYFRDYHTRNASGVHDHRTGRHCTQCGTELMDSIINFEESLPQLELENAIKNSKICDLSLVLGTSLRVSPACNLPVTNKKGKLVICNLQKTPFDDVAAMVVHSKTDQFMELLMRELGYQILDFIYKFSFKVNVNNKNEVEINEPSTNLGELLNSITIVNTKDKKQIIFKLDFNLLNPFTEDITVEAPCTVEVAVNVYKCKIEYKIL